MTFKTTKTILFASLIAAMILPFSGMMMAEAAPNENANNKAISHQEAYNLLNDYERDILFTSSLKAEDDKEKDKALNRIGLSKQLIVTQQRLDITEDETKQLKLEDKIQKILAKIDENRSNNVVVAELEEANLDNMAFGYGADWDTNPVVFNCADQNYFFAQNDGEQFLANSAGVHYWWDFKYPTEFDTGALPCGEDYDFALALIQSYNANGEWPLCTLTWPYNADGTVGASCWGPFDNYLALVTTDAVYDDNVNFKTEYSFILP